MRCPRCKQKVPPKVTIENQDRNGVKVRVHRSSEGSVVFADCKCFGFETRCHSTDRCPVYRRAVQGLTQLNPDPS